MSTELEIRTVKCSDTCQNNIKFVLTFTKNDLTVVETCAIALNFDLDMCQNCTGQHGFILQHFSDKSSIKLF